MNLSTLRDIYVEQALKFLGHNVPDFDSDNLPAFTNQHVLDRLDNFPDVILRVRTLQDEQESFKPTNLVQVEVKAFCQSAGRRLVQACTAIENLQDQLCSCSPNAAFSRHRVLINSLLKIRESIVCWTQSIDVEEFYGRHPRSVEVRFRYLKLTLRLVLIMVDLAFPKDMRPYVEGLQEVLEWPNLNKQIKFDNAASYAESKKLARVGLTAPHDRIPKRFVPYGKKVLRPYWYRNPNVYGHQQVPNAVCIRTCKGMFDPVSWQRKPGYIHSSSGDEIDTFSQIPLRLT